MATLEQFNILVSGVGGQGTILASDILCDAAMGDGYDVKKSDSLGMSQRGGSVVSHVRLGRQVMSPLIARGGAHVLLAFEKLEAARYAPFLRKGGVVIVNDHVIPPLLVSSGKQRYPSDDEIRGVLAGRTDRQFFVKGEEVALRLKNQRVLNLVMLGFLSAFLPLSERAWRDATVARVPRQFVELNLSAFALGKTQAVAEGKTA